MQIAGAPGYALARPIDIGGATVIPVTRRAVEQGQLSEYMTLDEARKNGWVEISELPGRETVELVLVANRGPRPLLLVAGDLLLGGKQDRVVAKDTVVPAGEKMEVPVFCVEHGRWEGESMSFSPSGGAVPQGVRSAAAFGRQQDVWDNVEQYNDSVSASDSSSSVRAGLETDAAKKAVDDRLERLTKELAQVDDVVGFVFVRNGNIQTLELFGNESLFRSGVQPILRGLLAESAPGVAGGSPISMELCARFVGEALSADRRQSANLRANSRWALESKTVAGAESKAATNQGEALIHGTYAPK
jgi:hypothetical protein